MKGIKERHWVCIKRKTLVIVNKDKIFCLDVDNQWIVNPTDMIKHLLK